MSRIRCIKPEFWTSEQVVACSMQARLLFIGLWNFCDDAGVHPASPLRLKMEVLPGDNCSLGDIKKWIDELITNNLIREYVVDGQSYWIITGWKKHQRIEKPTYCHPLPQSELKKISDNLVTVPRALGDYSTTVPKPLDDNSTSSRRELDERSTMVMNILVMLQIKVMEH